VYGYAARKPWEASGARLANGLPEERFASVRVAQPGNAVHAHRRVRSASSSSSSLACGSQSSGSSSVTTAGAEPFRRRAPIPRCAPLVRIPPGAFLLAELEDHSTSGAHRARDGAGGARSRSFAR